MKSIHVKFFSSIHPNSLIFFCHLPIWASPVAQTVKNLPAMQETWVGSLGWEDPPEKEWVPTPVFLLGESPWTEEPGGSLGLDAAE